MYTIIQAIFKMIMREVSIKGYILIEDKVKNQQVANDITEL